MLAKSDGSDRIDTQQVAGGSVINDSGGPAGSEERSPRVAVFGPFELNLITGELRKGGTRVRLQNKPFQILRALINSRGEVVTRDQLRHHVWPDDTFVDFESGLNTAANRLRLALNDSAEHPQYVETLPRVGYRFIGQVQFQTQPVSADTTETQPAEPAATPPQVHGGKTVLVDRLLFGVAAAAALVVIGLALWHGVRGAPPSASFHQLTFRKEVIDNARFTPSGEVVFSGALTGDSGTLYLMNQQSPEARQLPFGPANLAAVSPNSEISFFRRISVEGKYTHELAEAALYGGAPRVVARGIDLADRSATGEFSVVRHALAGSSVEYPIGHVLYETSSWLGAPRISPDGSRIALAEHPLRDDDSGFVLVLNREGKGRHLSDGWATIRDVSWSPKGNEVWFAAARHGINREIYAVDLRSHLRRVASMAAALDLFDIAPSGTVLIGRSTPGSSMYMGNMKTLAVKDISWLDWSHIAAISGNGNELLFDESGEGGGPLYTVYLYRRDRETRERIGTGRAMDISKDGAWILTSSREPSPVINLISADDAKTRAIRAPGFIYQSAYFLGTSRELLVHLSQPSTGGQHIYLQNMDTGALRQLPGTAPIERLAVSSAGTAVAYFVSDNRVNVLHLPSGTLSTIDTTEKAMPIGWANENTLIVAGVSGDRVHLDAIDITTQKRSLLSQLPPEVRDGVPQNFEFMVSADLSTFAYSVMDRSTSLFTATGWS